MNGEEGRRIEIHGIVQGVGFRPWVYRIARAIGVGGRVRNDASGVTIEAFGAPAKLDAFLSELGSHPPPAASIRDLHWEAIPPEDAAEFVIQPSRETDDRRVSIPPDLATCEDCLAEVFDPEDRRFRYPFTNCTNCGPRFTIAKDIPYDRPATTMAPFVMCEACRREYEDPADRRFHAQPNACPVCGPKLALLDVHGRERDGEGDAISRGVDLLRAGEIVAVKGLGGYHLACDACDPDVVTKLRVRKRRDEKPFAVMVRTLAEASRLAHLSPAESALLASIERPIVLLKARRDSPLAENVAPSNPLVGVMLSYTPLHHLLLDGFGGPLVMTSANLSDEPIVQKDDEAREKLHAIADAYLVHPREIETRADDSVARVIAAKPVLLRRSRGFVPRGVAVARPFARPVLGVGGMLKNTFCFGIGDTAVLGPHIGDLDNLETLHSFEEAVERMKRFLRVTPEVIAHDLHPQYPSTMWAREQTGVRVVGVQHHHAHVASAIAEHGLPGPVLGLAFDGTGWGGDGTAWGGEFLVSTLESFRRIATFRPLALPGGDKAIREPWRIALAAMMEAFGDRAPLLDLEVFRRVPPRELELVRRMLSRRVNTPLAHGLGRWFDAFASVGLARTRSTYEGQLPLVWTGIASESEKRAYGWEIVQSNEPSGPGVAPEKPWTIDLRATFRQAVEDLLAKVRPAVVSARFHNTLVAAVSQMTRLVLAEAGAMPVVLTGGSFQNARLAEGLVDRLEGVDVRLHRAVPPGDGGISLGQVMVADAVIRKED